MSEPSPQQLDQSLNISGSVLESVLIGGIAGRDLNLTQIQGEVGIINVFGTVQVPRASISVAKPISQEEYRRRTVLLSKVKQDWIEGILKGSLHTKVLIELGLEERKEFVQNPLSGVEEFPLDARKIFPEGTAATDIFESIGAGRTLLILGEPGAGKTVTLLKLAESLIARTENDLSQPLPVVMNLSSWTQQRKSITRWLVQELSEKYHIPKSLGKAWVEQEQLILLLDGLDEVDVKYRNSCVKALNEFIQEHGLTEIVVCSRIRDYENLSERLKLRSAICVQSLTSQQIDRFLERAGDSLFVLKTVLQNNAELRSFASSPLILSIMSLTYHDCSAEILIQAKTPEDQQKQLFDAYIDRMFTRRGRTRQYSREKTLRWLIWLAQIMTQVSQTVFLIEYLQPDLLSFRPSKAFFRLVNAITTSLIYGLFIVVPARLIDSLIEILIYGLVQDITNSSTFAQINHLIGSPIINLRLTLIIPIFSAFAGFAWGMWEALIYGLIAGSSGTIRLDEKLKWSLQATRKGYFNGFRIGFGIGSIGLIFIVLLGLFAGIFTGETSASFNKWVLDNYTSSEFVWMNVLNIIVLTSFFSGLLWLAVKLTITLTIPVLGFRTRDKLEQAFEGDRTLKVKNKKLSLKRCKFGLILVLCLSLFLGFIAGIGGTLAAYSIVLVICGAALLLFCSLIAGVTLGVPFGIPSAVISGFKTPIIHRQHNYPNQGIWEAAKNALILGSVAGVITALSVELIVRSGSGLIPRFIAVVLCVAPLGGLIGGGTDCIKHFILRLILFCQGYAPWNYARFLDYATARLFMQKVGGGYIFIHRMLLEHFAQMNLESK